MLKPKLGVDTPEAAPFDGDVEPAAAPPLVAVPVAFPAETEPVPAAPAAFNNCEQVPEGAAADVT